VNSYSILRINDFTTGLMVGGTYTDGSINTASIKKGKKPKDPKEEMKKLEEKKKVYSKIIEIKRKFK
jgi:hypothetical protein